MASNTRLVSHVPDLFYSFEVAQYVGVEFPFVKCYIRQNHNHDKPVVYLSHIITLLLNTVGKAVKMVE